VGTYHMTRPKDWVLLSLFPEHGVGGLHPDDVASATRLVPYGKVFEVVGDDGGYRVLRYNEVSIRVTASAPTRTVAAPPFAPAEGATHRTRILANQAFGVRPDVGLRAKIERVSPVL